MGSMADVTQGLPKTWASMTGIPNPRVGYEGHGITAEV